VVGENPHQASAGIDGSKRTLRDDYIEEIADGVGRWQRVIDNAGIPFRLTMPHKGFHRAIGNFAGHFISPDGEVLNEEAWKNHEFEWLPSSKDYAYVQSLMSGRVVEPGKFANWIAPPARGINSQPLNFEYVRSTSARGRVKARASTKGGNLWKRSSTFTFTSCRTTW